MKRFLYKLTFPNGKLYLGITHNVSARFRVHKSNAAAGKQHAVHNAIRKFGAESVVVETLAAGSMEYIAELEIKAIVAYGSLVPNGYNMAIGGEIGPMSSRNHSDKSKRKMSRGQKRRVRTPEELARMTTMARSKTFGPEYRRKLSEAAKARWEDPVQRLEASERSKRAWRPISEEAKAKAKATVQSPEFRAAQSERMKLHYSTHPASIPKGTKRPVEFGAKISAAKKGYKPSPAQLEALRKTGADWNARRPPGPKRRAMMDALL